MTYKLKTYDPRKDKHLKPRKKINQRYWQTDLKPLGDFDRDNKINLLDCYPYDPNRQGITDVIKKPIQKVKEFKDKYQKQKQEYEEKAKDYLYVIAKQKDGKWLNLGAVDTISITQAIQQVESNPNFTEVMTSEDPKKAEKLNRVEMYESFEEGTEKVLTKGVEGLKKSYEGFTKVAKSERAKEIGTGPSGMSSSRGIKPPMSKGWYGSPEQQQAKMSIPNRSAYPTAIKTQELKREEPFESEEYEFGYSHKSPFYQERSSFYNYDRNMETCVPYRPIGYKQVFAPYKPVGLKRRRRY